MDLPRPDVTVTETSEAAGPTTVRIAVSRDGKARLYSGTGPSSEKATGEAVKEMLNDPVIVEYVKEHARGD